MTDNPLILSEDSKIVSWKNKNKSIKIQFQRPVFRAILSKYADGVVVIADNEEVGANNLFIYNRDGTLRANPDIPKKDIKFKGIYDMWYVENQVEQTIVLISDKNTDYDTKCFFNLNDNTFSNFSLTK